MASESFKKIISELEKTGDYRVLEKIKKPRFDKHTSSNFKIAAVLDTETTGINYQTDEIIELGIVKFLYSEDGKIISAISEFKGFMEPKTPIPPAVTKLTGISNSKVRGKKIDLNLLFSYMSDVSLVIAHNAGFDRAFCEKTWPDIFTDKAWACSIKDIMWKNEGLEGSSLSLILTYYRYFHQGHRAVEDCYALFKILSQQLPETRQTAFQQLLLNARKTTVRIWAEDSPFEERKILKERGYQWCDGTNNKKRSWWVDVEKDKVESELSFLRQAVYKKDLNIPMKEISAFIRYSGREDEL